MQVGLQLRDAPTCRELAMLPPFHGAYMFDLETFVLCTLLPSSGFKTSPCLLLIIEVCVHAIPEGSMLLTVIVKSWLLGGCAGICTAS